jgi:hypothetical protein
MPMSPSGVCDAVADAICCFHAIVLTLQNAAAAIDAKANVCSVQFSPTDANLMAFGGANYRTYLYDLRHIQVRCCAMCFQTSACGVCCKTAMAHLGCSAADQTFWLD